MAITIKLIVEHESDKTVYFLVTAGGVEYRYHADIPIDAVPAEWWAVNQDDILVQMLKKAYPGADISEFTGEGVTTLQAIQAWVAAGHKNPDVLDDEDNVIEEGEVIEREEVNTHPDSIALNEEIDAATTVDDIKVILRQMI